MKLEKTKALLSWLEKNQPERKYTIEELQKLIDIAILEATIQNDNFMEKLPASVVKRMIEESKESGDLYKLDKFIDQFKI